MRARWASAGALALAVALLSGCGSTPEPTPQPSDEPTPTQHGSYAQCLREHGVPAPAGPVTGPPPGVAPETWKQAMADCASLAPGPVE
ncbi:putative lipoprotein [Mycolicibacterium hassiacum DSM 44199]|jgi:hypothetical protein|uniref:Putative lipoprotein n=1 Tax=Mycolicibacterium hassiacum (strain DSM 44199 / CIP 105218 / JCM 12690 / 3849) TaxID=1122247 RepID=K5BIZ6_MYCHD|nr:hypothetical protein [Mycolicibacterium hassiacum]EKF22229.1 putative lipoprotein [Mycolicibacterium hassiacum DSM 44199]MDA4087498.1 hypothetical protein [Mycolicibacterium hassiacum DSM 44199]PZN17537.1 MAG: hypothetical protein DIU75_19015 [Mycolicibacterium hassiacum]VCT91878.1 hypothetical protein MHAS_03601 [Mycolicibacterium hassiacum DSM 44199]